MNIFVEISFIEKDFWFFEDWGWSAFIEGKKGKDENKNQLAIANKNIYRFLNRY